MQIIIYIVIGLIVIGIIFALAKFILFNPRANSIISLIGFTILYFYAVSKYNDASFIFFLIIIDIDCIRDIVLAYKYYDYVDVGSDADKFYIIKSIVSLLTLGVARILFLIIVNPIIHLNAKSIIKGKISAGSPLPADKCGKNQQVNYYYAKELNKFSARAELVSNKSTVDSEIKIMRKRLDAMYPSKFLMKVADFFAGDKDMKEKRKNAEQMLSSDALKEYYAYLPSRVFGNYQQTLINAMSDKTTLSVEDIKKLPELAAINANVPLDSQNGRNSDYWSTFFIVMALSPLIQTGEFEDLDCNTKDPIDIHSYHYTRSTKQMISVNANDDPSLALDDDDDF